MKNLADEFQIPALEGEELYNVFFQMRLDHPEIFWVSSYKYRYYKDSPNLIFIPEYLFDKKKICEHQKAMTARVEKLIRPAQKLSEWGNVQGSSQITLGNRLIFHELFQAFSK